MADINHVITLGIGTPSGITEFITFGLQIGAAADPVPYDATITLHPLYDMNIKAHPSISMSAKTHLIFDATVTIND